MKIEKGPEVSLFMWILGIIPRKAITCLAYLTDAISTYDQVAQCAISYHKTAKTNTETKPTQWIIFLIMRIPSKEVTN